MAAIAYMLAILAAGMSGLLCFRVRSAASILLWMPKALAGSAAPFVAVLGFLGAACGLLSRAYLAIAAGGLGALLSVRHVMRIAAPHDGFTQAFGSHWQRQIPPEQRARLLKRRWGWQLPSYPGVRWDRDVSFWTIPGTGRELLCDIWQPPEGVSPSGLGFVYLHGGAWHWMDKDFGTRPLFRHLAAQGHVVMDVAYRLCPEVDLYGMLGDVKRAIVWIKANGKKYGVDPARVVVAGGSTGGHLAMLAAYAPDHPELTPGDVQEADRSVRAVVSYYGPADMRAAWQHFDATFGSLGKWAEGGAGSLFSRVIGAMTGWMLGEPSEDVEEQDLSDFSFNWLMANLLGGSPDEVPEVYDLASPITHAGPDSPPTLLLQGEQDSFLPGHVNHALHRRLIGTGVPSVCVVFPQTEHGFDLLLPRHAPAAQAALYDLDRFLALMV